jgi:hypothetical protein
MTAEQSLVEQQRAVVELYVNSKWIKASLALDDENLFLEYAHDYQTPAELSDNHHEISNESTIHDISDTISSEKRTIKIVKQDNTGLGMTEI